LVQSSCDHASSDNQNHRDGSSVQHRQVSKCPFPVMGPARLQEAAELAQKNPYLAAFCSRVVHPFKGRLQSYKPV
jgi:hypothetical protein